MGRQQTTEAVGDPFDSLAAALDEESWDWLVENASGIATGVSDAVDAGVEASDVRRFVMRQTMRYELSLRCEQAARYLLARRVVNKC